MGNTGLNIPFALFEFLYSDQTQTESNRSLCTESETTYSKIMELQQNREATAETRSARFHIDTYVRSSFYRLSTFSPRLRAVLVLWEQHVLEE